MSGFHGLVGMRMCLGEVVCPYQVDILREITTFYAISQPMKTHVDGLGPSMFEVWFVTPTAQLFWCTSDECEVRVKSELKTSGE